MSSKKVTALVPGDRVVTKWGEVGTVASTYRANVRAGGRTRLGVWVDWGDGTASGYAASDVVELAKDWGPYIRAVKS